MNIQIDLCVQFACSLVFVQQFGYILYQILVTLTILPCLVGLKTGVICSFCLDILYQIFYCQHLRYENCLEHLVGAKSLKTGIICSFGLQTNHSYIYLIYKH